MITRSTLPPPNLGPHPAGSCACFDISKLCRTCALFELVSLFLYIPCYLQRAFFFKTPHHPPVEGSREIINPGTPEPLSVHMLSQQLPSYKNLAAFLHTVVTRQSPLLFPAQRQINCIDGQTSPCLQHRCKEVPEIREFGTTEVNHRKKTT